MEYVLCVRTLVHRLGDCQVVIVREKLDSSTEQTGYFATTLVNADSQTIVNVLAVRWDIETLFEDWKELFGTDHYQLITDRAIVRYWTFAACAHLFLGERNVEMAQMRDRHITLGEARQDVQEGLRITRDCRVEAIMKDNNTIRNDLSRIVRWVCIAREEAERV